METSWNKLRSNILEAAEEAMGKRKIYKSRKRNTKPWFTIEVKDLAAEKRKAYTQHRNKVITYEQYKTVRNRVNTKIQEIKRKYWEKFSTDMEHDMYGGQKKIWKMLRSRKKPVNEYIQISKITTEEWEKHFHNLYVNSTTTTPEDTEEQEIIEENMTKWTITREKIKETTTKLKNRKAPGLDNIHNELIKYGGEELLEELHTFYNKIATLKKIPEEWRKSITIPIFKKGSKAEPKNYRGITLLSTVLKLLTKIIADEVTQTGISEEQQGFRQNRSTIDAIFILRQITEKSIEFNKTAFMCFIDLKQAFDKVRLRDVLRTLKKRNVDPTIIKIIKELNTGNTAVIKTNNTLSKTIPVLSGIRQGDSLSPILFNVIMDEIIKDVKTAGRGYRLGNKEIKIVCYADDAVIISEDEDNLQRLLYRFEKAAARFNMVISSEKTQSLTISKEPRRCKLAIYDRSVEQVMSFKYLGANITSNRNLKSEVKEHTVKASLISGFLRDVIWRNKYMSINSKVRIYKTCVRPILSYAVETRAETTTTKRLLRTTEMRTLRSITGYTLRDRQRSEEIRNKCNTEDIVRWSRMRRREWNNHVERMSDDRLAKIARKERPNTTRPIGRPPKRWHESWTSTSQN